MAIDAKAAVSAERHATLQELLARRERLLERLKLSTEAGDLEAVATLEYAIAECDGVIALITSISARH
jgi:hypothetical protein